MVRVESPPLLTHFNPTVEADGDLVCQPGAKWMDINATLEEKGMIYVPSFNLV